jgi:hypothetical protein
LTNTVVSLKVLNTIHLLTHPKLKSDKPWSRKTESFGQKII